MGYVLNKLGNLPVDTTVTKYVYLVGYPYDDDLSKNVKDNFFNLAKSMGDRAILAVGVNQEEFHDEVGKAYFGDDWYLYLQMMPALIITDSHPETITPESERIFIPLDKVQKFYPNWGRFFALLAEYVQGKSNTLKDKLQPKTDAFDKANKIISIKPSFLGISINFNEILSSIVQDAKDAQRAPLVR